MMNEFLNKTAKHVTNTIPKYRYGEITYADLVITLATDGLVLVPKSVCRNPPCLSIFTRVGKEEMHIIRAIDKDLIGGNHGSKWNP